MSSSPSSRRVRNPITQCTLEDPGRTIHHVRIEPQSAIVGRHPPVHLRTGELQHPADVCRGNEVPGRPQYVGAKDASPFNGALYGGVVRPVRRTQRKAPLGRPVLLRLHRPEPCDHPVGRQQSGAGDALVMKSLMGNPRAQWTTRVRVMICPACRAECSAAWKIRPSVVEGSRLRPTSRG